MLDAVATHELVHVATAGRRFGPPTAWLGESIPTLLQLERAVLSRRSGPGLSHVRFPGDDAGRTVRACPILVRLPEKVGRDDVEVSVPGRRGIGDEPLGHAAGTVGHAGSWCPGARRLRRARRGLEEGVSGDLGVDEVGVDVVTSDHGGLDEGLEGELVDGPWTTL